MSLPGVGVRERMAAAPLGQRGHGDGVYINTAGIGVRLANVDPGLDKIAVGDKILINGTIGVRDSMLTMPELLSSICHSCPYRLPDQSDNKSHHRICAAHLLLGHLLFSRLHSPSLAMCRPHIER